MQHLSPAVGGRVRDVGRLRPQCLFSNSMCRADNRFLYPVLCLCTAGWCVAVFLFVGLSSLCKCTFLLLVCQWLMHGACCSPSCALARPRLREDWLDVRLVGPCEWQCAHPRPGRLAPVSAVGRIGPVVAMAQRMGGLSIKVQVEYGTIAFDNLHMLIWDIVTLALRSAL